MPINRKIGSNLTPQVELIGEWNKTRTLLHLLPKLIKIGSLKGQQSAAKHFRRIVRRHIRNNGASLGWAPLSSAYKKSKGRRGFNPDRIYYASGSYYNNIKVWRRGTKIFIGIKKNVKSKSSRSSLTIGMIARILEYGSLTRNIPARPLWAPSYRDFGGGKRIKGFMTWHIRNQIFKATGVKAKITI